MRFRDCIPWLITCAFLLTLPACAPKQIRRTTPRPRPMPFADEPVTVRVLLGEAVRSFKVSLPRGGTVEERPGAAAAAPYAFSGEYSVDPHSLPPGGVVLRAPRGKALGYGMRRYPGSIELRMAAGAVQVINRVDLEEYTACVMMAEVSPKWPRQALRAQAVVTRTFALHHYLRGGEAALLTAEVSSQVYRGLLKGMDPARRAAADTAGQVLWHKGEVITAFFHANCGGCTADSERVWSAKLSYLRSRWCRYCRDHKHYSWQLVLPRQELASICAGKGLPGVYGLKLKGKDNSGRVKQVCLLSPLGERELRAVDFRALIGYDKLRSTKFKIKQDAKNIYFEGKGWGHGVGLCQEGALGMAEEGADYKSILRFYYRGCKLKKR